MIDGFDIRSINVKYLRSNIGLVTQEPVLFNCSIRDNILYGVEDDFYENDDAVLFDRIIPAAKAANIHNFIINLPQVNYFIYYTIESRLSKLIRTTGSSDNQIEIKIQIKTCFKKKRSN